MERYFQRESVLLGYSNPQRSFIDPSSSQNSQFENSDFDFKDVFGGPPRRSSLQEMRYSCGETTDSFSLRNVDDDGDDDTSLIGRRWSGLNEKPVFGDEGVNRRRYTSSDFFDDIFRGNEALSCSPGKNDRDSIYSTPASRVLSPVRPLPNKADPFASSLSPAHLSLPAKLIEGTDLPTFISSTHNHQKNKDGASNGTSYSSYSPLSRFSSQVNQVREELRNDVYHQSCLSQELSFSSEESSSLTKPDEKDKGRNLKGDSNRSKASSNGSQFHFSIYKWSSKGIPFAMPPRGGNKSTLKEKCKLQRCSSTNGWIACKGIAREIPTEIPNDIDIPSFISHTPSDAKSFGMELDKQENGSLSDTSKKDRAEQCQTVEDETPPKYESEAPSTCQVIVKDIPGGAIFQNSREGTKSHPVLDPGLSGKMEEEIPVVTQKAQKTELKSLRSLLFDNDNEQDVPSRTSNNDYEQDVDEVAIKNEPKESKVKSIKKLSAVFDVGENIEAKYGKITTLNNEMDKTNFQGSPARDNLGKNRVRGKVKEFVKIFTQEAPNKPKFDVDFQRQSSRWKERSKLRTENETKTDEKKHLPNVNKNNMPDASVGVLEYHKQANKHHPETRSKNQKPTNISSGNKDSSASNAASIPNGSVVIIGDADESFQGNFLMRHLNQVEDKLPQTGNDHEEIQVIDAKIKKWSNGKEGNIRSLLSTLQYVLWPNSGWKPVPLVDIIEGNAVKRSYQKALLCLHPDKLLQKGANSHQKYIAEKVFDILQFMRRWNYIFQHARLMGHMGFPSPNNLRGQWATILYILGLAKSTGIGLKSHLVINWCILFRHLKSI